MFRPNNVLQCIVVTLIAICSLLVPRHSSAQVADLTYRVYLIGDTGGSDPANPSSALRRLKELLAAESSQSAVVFLGDNIYCCGLPDSSSARRAQAEMRIDSAIDAVDGFAGRTIFIPGNHDWGASVSILSRNIASTATLHRGPSW